MRTKILSMLVLLMLFIAASAGQGDKQQGKPLFDGKTLEGWKSTDFGGEGVVEVKDGTILMERGNPMTGVTYARKDLPKMDYELTLEGKRVAGSDFFCTTTFPVADSFCSLVVGGWGGTVVGLSSLDMMDASENDTTTLTDFKKDQWYRIRIRVTKGRIQSWIDAKKVVDADVREKQVGLRIECEPCRPLGVATYNTTGAVRDIRIRPLTDAEKAEVRPKD